MAAAVAAEGVTIAPEDPRSGDARDLITEMEAFTAATYPEDSEIGVPFTSAEELAAEGVLLVARADGAAIGTGSVVRHPPVEGVAVMEVKRMYVREAARGRRVAERVLAALENVARNEGAEALVLMCGPRQPAALRMYERCGFRRRSTYGGNPEHPLCIYFEKRLSGAVR
jgi:putative acetyltransferase